jgi:hypothetical protein
VDEHTQPAHRRPPFQHGNIAFRLRIFIRAAQV